MSCKIPLSSLTSLNFGLIQQKDSKNDKESTKNCNTLGSKTSKNDLSTLNYALPGNFRKKRPSTKRERATKIFQDEIRL